LHHEKDNYIILDHLSPLTSDKKEFANYYGPDLTFDAFRWINGKWTLFENVKAVNPKSSNYFVLVFMEKHDKCQDYQLSDCIQIFL